MKKEPSKPEDNKVLDILKLLTKRVEEATVDIHEMKSDLKFVNLRLHNVETSVGIVKVDMQNMRTNIQNMKVDIGTMKTDIRYVKRNTDDLIETTSEILAKMVTQEELKSLSERVISLEQQ